jgi:phage terminase large subunit-like protein
MVKYSKVYWIGCDPDKAPNLMEHYDSVLTPAIQSSEYHVGHHMVEAGSGKWLLVSNYHDKAGADAAVPMVQELVKPMVEQYGMTLEVITEGKVARSI